MGGCSSKPDTQSDQDEAVVASPSPPPPPPTLPQPVEPVQEPPPKELTKKDDRWVKEETSLPMFPRYSEDEWLGMALRKAAEEEAAEEAAKGQRQVERHAAEAEAAAIYIALTVAKTSIDAGVQLYLELAPEGNAWGQVVRSFMSMWSAMRSFQQVDAEQQASANKPPAEELPNERQSFMLYKVASGAGDADVPGAKKTAGNAFSFARQVSALKVAAMDDAQVLETRRLLYEMTEDLRVCSLSAGTSDLLARTKGSVGEKLRELWWGHQPAVDGAGSRTYGAFNYDGFDWQMVLEALKPQAQSVDAAASGALAVACLQIAEERTAQVRQWCSSCSMRARNSTSLAI